MSGTTGLSSIVREIELHAASAGWDQPAKMFALVSTAELLAAEPQLAEALGIEGDAPANALTPVEQEAVPTGQELEQVLAEILWPPQVLGCAVVVERLVLPPEAEDSIPEDPAEAASYAANHPERQEVRIVAAAVRNGEAFCAMRLRSHDEDESVVTATDLVPALLELLHATLEPEPGA